MHVSACVLLPLSSWNKRFWVLVFQFVVCCTLTVLWIYLVSLGNSLAANQNLLGNEIAEI